MGQWNVYDQRFPWVQWTHHPQGGFVVRDARQSGTYRAPTWEGVLKFAADHSTQQGKSGLGDLVAGFTGALGIEKCTPCAQRQADMNQWLQFNSDWNPFS